ncbi:MAG: hypothetical protein H0V17_18045 [Deltaproteobacteria bacterium]|nr:hypothetical protein [Deltaproteobacteria bacterium]
MMCAIALVLAACGGSEKSAQSTGPGGATAGLSECAVVGGHVSESVMKWKEPPPTTKESVARVISERCEADQWSAAAKKCFGSISDEESAKPCVDTLSKDQHDKVMNAMEATFDHKGHAGHDADDADEQQGGTGSRAPASARPPAPSKGADPCEGGE